MSAVVDPGFRGELAEYGADMLAKCMHCGNCTAICSLTSEENWFPRRVIRYAQLGLKDRILSEKDIWLCYYCGDCSRTCPRQVEPGELMAAMRRYAIAQYDATGIASLMYRKPWLNAVVFVLLSLFFTALLLARAGQAGGLPPFFDWVPFEWIHDTGVALFVVVGIALLWGVLSMVRRILAALRLRDPDIVWKRGQLGNAVAWAVGESLRQKRYASCHQDDPYVLPLPWYRQPWFLHAMILWGFLGLLAATTLDFLFKEPGSYVPLWYPIRLLGTVSGLVCLVGTAATLWRRIGKPDNYYGNTKFSDWFLLVLLLATVLTGFLAELVVYVSLGTPVDRFLFLVHVVLAMDLIVLLPLTKFAHAVYRPLALTLFRWYELSKQAAAESVQRKAA